MLFRTASRLVFALLAGAAIGHATERMKIEVVQTHTGVNRGVSSPGPGDSAEPDPISTQCNGSSGVYARDLGFYCQGPVLPLGQPPGGQGYSLFIDISVVMPDTSRVVFHCSTVLDPGCEAIPTYPIATSVVCSDFVHGGSAYKDCTATGSSPNGIGVYQVALHGDRMTIFGANWQRHYLKYGTWEYPDPPAPDPKPDPPQETKPAQQPDAGPAAAPDPKLPSQADQKPAATQNADPDPPQDPKPALPPETQPAAPPNPNPAAPQETKPALPPDTQPATPPSPDSAAPQDAKPATLPDTQPPESKPPESKPAPEPEHAAAAAHSLSAAADQAIDPQVVEQAKAGDASAQYKLGYDYYLGRGVALDYVQAAIWWRKSADQGFPQAQNNLGVLYNAGKGVPQSYTEAYFWENLAAARASGNLQVQFAKNRDESASKLWFMARLSVQRKAAKWASEHPVPPRSNEPPGAPKP